MKKSQYPSKTDVDNYLVATDVVRRQRSLGDLQSQVDTRDVAPMSLRVATGFPRTLLDNRPFK